LPRRPGFEAVDPLRVAATPCKMALEVLEAKD
jgi:hypothetical protein